MKHAERKTYWTALGAARRPGAVVAGADAPIVAAPAEGGVGRREFLQLAGFAMSAAALTGCSRGVEHAAIPYLVRPEEITPGKAYWYASVCGACPAGCGILTKNRDGRPIKLEGNPGHPVSRGGLCAVGQASVLELYDSQRLRHPLQGGEQADWPVVDQAIVERLAKASRVRLLTDSTTGPAEQAQIAAFLSRFVDGRQVTYDPLSVSAIAEAHEATHGASLVPRYRFENAEAIVSVGADFLGTWISPVEHTAGYRARRRLGADGGSFSYHIQFEPRMSLTGSNADRRVVVPPGSSALVLAHLAGELAHLGGTRAPWNTLPASPVDRDELSDLARRLWHAPRGRTLVVCGDNDVVAQRITNFANHLLENDAEGGTVDLAGASSQRRGRDGDLRGLLDELQAGQVDALFIRGGNPVYDLPAGGDIARALDRVPLVVSFAPRRDETARHAHFVCPEPHFLESWGDSEPVAGVAALRQPAIRSMGSVRPLLESLAIWSGRPAAARDLVRDWWRESVYPRRTSASSFDSFWNQALHDGHVSLRPRDGAGVGRFAVAAVSAPPTGAVPPADELLLDVHPSVGLLDGRHAHNAWLQELPDPIAKTVWDNFASLSLAAAEALGLVTGEVIRITPTDGAGAAVELPALVQPGQHDRALAVTLGYGREGTDRFARVGPQWLEGRLTVEEGRTVGTNAAPLLAWDGRTLVYTGRRVRVESTGRHHHVAATQEHHSLDVPEHLAVGDPRRGFIVQETTLAAWRQDPAAGGHGAHADLPSLYEDHPKSPHHWGLAVDLTACTGCAGCVIACQAENNTPVVGKDEVGRAREMHWMRIDRYYSGDGSDVDVVHMPMMCQHCDNAPCENVCPVQATAQSAEGLNQQIYNRCVGTRYCANNCPYKVRRFNWFDYPREDRLQNLSLNPDVTVRSRGVMEKCSLCVQRILDGKAEAKRAGRGLADGDIQPACVQSCPASAITFGDMNDPGSRLSAQKHDPRHYVALQELGVKPVVGYLTLVRNRHDGGGGSHHG